MAPRTAEQFEKIRSSRKFEIMEAALEVFADVGYHKASIAQIARQAKISKGLIYNYFESKEDLLKAVLLQGIEGLKESFLQMDEALDTPEELELFIKGGMEIMRTESNYYKLYFSVMMQPAAYVVVKDNYPEFMGELIEGIAYYFETKGDPYPLEKATILASTLDGIGMHYIMAPELHNLEIYEKIIFDLFK